MESGKYVFMAEKPDLPLSHRVFQGGAIDWPDFANPSFQRVLKEQVIGERAKIAIFNIGDKLKAVVRV